MPYRIGQFFPAEMLSDKELRKCISSYVKTRDEEMFKRIISSHIVYIVKMALIYNSYHGGSSIYDDLISAGIDGVMRSIKTYGKDKNKPQHVFHMSTFYIRSKMRNVLKNMKNQISVPSTCLVQSKQIKEMLTNHKTKAEICKTMKITSHMYDVILNWAGQTHNSFDHNIDYHGEPIDSESAFRDQMIDSDVSHDEKSDMTIEYVLETAKQVLTPREYEILCRRHGVGGYKFDILEDIKDDMRCSRERVRQIETNAICKLREFMINNKTFKPLKQRIRIKKNKNRKRP